MVIGHGGERFSPISQTEVLQQEKDGRWKEIEVLQQEEMETP